MTTTPVFGIRGPDASTKAKDLPASLAQQNLDIEAALLLAQIPPTVPANVYVAPTAAARDLKFGKPTTANARLALQNSGALCIRPDLGYTEQYFAGLTDGGTNPGGQAAAGWYPVFGPDATGSISVPSGVTHSVSLCRRDFRREVSVSLVAKRAAGLDNAPVVAVLPAGFRPAAVLSLPGAASEGGAAQTCFIQIQTNGSVLIYGAGAGNTAVGFTAKFTAA